MSKRCRTPTQEFGAESSEFKWESSYNTMCELGGIDALVLGSWVGARRPFHLSVFLTAPRMVLPQDPSTRERTVHVDARARPIEEDVAFHRGVAADRGEVPANNDGQHL